MEGDIIGIVVLIRCLSSPTRLIESHTWSQERVMAIAAEEARGGDTATDAVLGAIKELTPSRTLGISKNRTLPFKLHPDAFSTI
jgi:hypothetical protein